MKLLWQKLKLIILKLDGEGKCITSCTWCDEWTVSSTKGYSFSSLQERIHLLRRDFVSDDTRFFLYGKNIFRMPFYLELIEYIKKNPDINFDFHLTTKLEERDLKELIQIKSIPNLRFTFCQSYSTIDKPFLEQILQAIWSKEKQNQVVIIADKEKPSAKLYLDSLQKFWDFEFTFSPYPNFIGQQVTETGLEKCLVLDNFAIHSDFIEVQPSVLLEILENGDVRLHNYLCNLANIDISNIYKTPQGFLADFKRFIYFYFKFQSHGDFEHNCYQCIRKIKYSYRLWNK